jgi:hypothetical protein
LRGSPFALKKCRTKASIRIGSGPATSTVSFNGSAIATPARAAAIGANNWQGNMVPHAGGTFRSKKVSAWCLEEVQYCRVLPRRRVRYVNDNLSADQRFSQSFTSDGVDAGRRWGRHDLMTILPKVVHELSADEPAAADDDDLHILIYIAGAGRFDFHNGSIIRHVVIFV